jgi:hypothetical protein
MTAREGQGLHRNPMGNINFHMIVQCCIF